MGEHRLDACLATARHAMARRERPLGTADEQALRGLFEDSAAERRAAPRAPAAS